MRPSKRQKISDDDDHSISLQLPLSEAGTSDSHGSEKWSDDELERGDTASSADDLADIKPQKSRQTKKRKLRASAPSAFGTTLQSLLNTSTSSSLPLSLKPSVARKQNDEKLEQKAKRVLLVEKREKQDQGHIRDVIGGWGGESERTLRKVAQRGVVKLFNVIQQAQSEASALEENKSTRGTGKPSLQAPTIGKPSKIKSKAKDKDNLLGRGKEVDHHEFFDMIKAGGIVSKI